MAQYELGFYLLLLVIVVQTCLTTVTARAVDEYDGGAVVEKRRIGLRLPNILHLSGDDPQLIEKRRIGLRMPNIIYLRGPDEKKSSSASSWFL